MAHTPGPWRIDAIWGLIKHGKEEICALHSGNIENALLIAAAPEMLELLKRINAMATQTRSPSENDLYNIITIYTLVAKIEGRE